MCDFFNVAEEHVMNILLVEDNILDRQAIIKLIHRWEEAHFPVGLNVLEQIHEDNIMSYTGYDVALLDIEIPGVDGLAFATELRKHNSRIEIAFVTNHPEYSLYGYGAHACAYLLKPVKEKELFNLLDFISQHTMGTHSNDLKICISRGVSQQDFYLPNDILYVESGLHGIFVRSLSERRKYNLPLVQMRKILPEKTFVQCHRSFIVNITKVVAIQKDSAILVNGERICIGNKYYHDLKRALIGLR